MDPLIELVEDVIETIILINLVVIHCKFLFQWLMRKKKDVYGKHVVVTGGSSGIGLWVAINAARKGADVTIVARSVKTSEKAVKAVAIIRENCVRDDQRVEYYSLDVSQDHDFIINESFRGIERKSGDIYMLVNCAGMAIYGTIKDIKPEDEQFLIDLNYLGTFYPIQYVLPKMKERKDGIIVLTSSYAGLISDYSAAKSPVRAIAEKLALVTKHLGINVTLGLPADTNTPEKVGKKLFEDALKGNFFSIIGFKSWMLSILYLGLSPWKTPVLSMLQYPFMCPLRAISLILTNLFHKSSGFLFINLSVITVFYRFTLMTHKLISFNPQDD